MSGVPLSAAGAAAASGVVAVSTTAVAVTTSATPGTATTALASNSARKYLEVSLPRTAASSVWISVGSVAVRDAPSIEILPGGYWTPDNAMPTGAVSVISSGASIKLGLVEG